MTFEELAWGAVFYRLLTNYDRPYVSLFGGESLLERLRQNPAAVSADEFQATVGDFLRRWGGRHIKNDTEVGRALLDGLGGLRSTFRSLCSDTLLATDLGHRRGLVQDVFDGLRLICWENRGPSRSVTVHLGETFASKLAHIMNPALFVMWDDGIAGDFCTRGMIGSLWDYVGFLEVMQREARSAVSSFQAFAGSGDAALFLSQELGYPVTKQLAKFLDEYNWVCSQRSLRTCIPPGWLLRLR